MKIIYHNALIALRKIYQRIYGKPATYLDRIMDADAVEELIYSKIVEGKPLMISRFGAVEISAVVNYLSIKEAKHNPWSFIKGDIHEWWWNNGVRNCMKNNAGFFSNDDKNLANFGELMLRDMGDIDILLSWQHDEHFLACRFPNAICVGFIFVDPFWSKKPWTRALTGRKVLVIHPFAEEIEYQYKEHRMLIHSNREILPKFELKTLKAVQSIGGNTEFETWFDALEYMKNQIQSIDFDISLLGCGAYGMPLAAYIKNMGKQAIHFGGSLQLLFGIRGKRWENNKYGANYFSDKIGHYPELMNEYWIRPFNSSIFDAAKRVEGGCYW